MAGAPSAVARTSSSTPSMPRRTAASNAAIVFSNSMVVTPRWAQIAVIASPFGPSANDHVRHGKQGLGSLRRNVLLGGDGTPSLPAPTGSTHGTDVDSARHGLDRELA